MQTSTALQVGNLYTRRGLQSRFSITDMTLNNGIFHPDGHDSVWLFVTKNKTADRTDYADKLVGDVLTMEGQT